MIDTSDGTRYEHAKKRFIWDIEDHLTVSAIPQTLVVFMLFINCLSKLRQLRSQF